jgi:predicted transcriptional regulator
METNLQERKVELIQWISVIEDEAVLEKIADVRNQITADWWNEISAAEKESIDRGLAEADAGKLSPHTTARSIYEKWL